MNMEWRSHRCYPMEKCGVHSSGVVSNGSHLAMPVGVSLQKPITRRGWRHCFKTRMETLSLVLNHHFFECINRMIRTVGQQLQNVNVHHDIPEYDDPSFAAGTRLREEGRSTACRLHSAIRQTPDLAHVLEIEKYGTVVVMPRTLLAAVPATGPQDAHWVDRDIAKLAISKSLAQDIAEAALEPNGKKLFRR